MRPRLAMVGGLIVALMVISVALGLTATALTTTGQPQGTWTSAGTTVLVADQAAPSETAKPTTTTNLSQTKQVTVETTGFWSWALLAQSSGEVVGSTNYNTTQVSASMIKAWLAADYLRRAAEKKQQPTSSMLNQLSIMIRDSDNDAATSTYALVGKAESIKRLVSICKLTDTSGSSNWARTMISARDAVRMGQCISDGRAAGSTWTSWVLTEMRSVRGAGRFGIIEALPKTEAAQLAIKNGWVDLEDGKWHINCLAIGNGWVLAVETVYPVSKGMSHGAAICKSVATQLVA